MDWEWEWEWELVNSTLHKCSLAPLMAMYPRI